VPNRNGIPQNTFRPTGRFASSGSASLGQGFTRFLPNALFWRVELKTRVKSTVENLDMVTLPRPTPIRLVEMTLPATPWQMACPF
jgi:hypothetical protein